MTLYTAAPGTGATMFPSRTVHWWGAFGGGSYKTSEVGVAFAWIHIDLVTLVSLWRHCHLPSAQFQTTHFLVRLPRNKARTSIAIVPHDFFAGTRNGRKWWRVRRQGLGTISEPEEGTSTIEKLQMEFQMELQKVRMLWVYPNPTNSE